MFDQILDLVGQPPGSLVYHFIILFAVEAALAISLGQWMRERDNSTARLTVATAAIFTARSLVLIGSLLAWQGFFPRNVLLPPIERAVDTITVLGLFWAFVTMDDPAILQRNFIPDLVTTVVLAMAVAGFVGTYYYWSSSAVSGQLFNGLWLDVAWNVAQVVLSVGGLVWMLTRVKYVYDPFLRGIMLIILGGAAAVHLVQPTLGDVAATMRVGQIIVMPMLAAVAYRHVVEQLLHWDEFEPSRPAAEAPAFLTPPSLEPVRVEPEPPPTEEATEVAGKPQDAPDSHLQPASQAVLLEVVETLGGLHNTLEQSEISREAARVVATVLRADICALAVVDEGTQEAGIIGGYDNITQAFLPQAVLDLSDHPTIVNALGRLRQMRLTNQRNGRELRDFYEKLSITHVGPAYVQPLLDAEERIGVLIVGSPYSERLLSNEERNLLDRLSPLVSAALLNAEAYRIVQEEGQRIAAEEGARLAALSDELTAARTELDTAQRQMEEMKAYIRDMHRQLESIQQADPEQVARLRAEVEQLETALAQSQELQTRYEEIKDRYATLVGENEDLRQASAELERLREDNQRLLEKILEQTPDADRIAQLEEDLERLQREGIPLAAHDAALSASAFDRQLEEARLASQTEIASLRARLTQAAISQQEVTFLQEQLAAKAREAIALQTRLTEAEAVVNALREQIRSGPSSTLETLQARMTAQVAEIAGLRSQLAEAQAHAQLGPEALLAQQEIEAIDREGMAQLEAQLAERTALIEALNTQLADKARAITELKAHMGEVETSLRNLERQLSHKTEEIATLQESLADTRRQAQERIATLEAQIESGVSDEADIQRARVEMLEAELAEKATAVEVLEAQLQSANQAMRDLESQLTATSEAVGAAISDARQDDSHDEVIASIAQELRTPMSSIMGYTELLLRESVGILGSLQRKFLQRVKANTERMGVLLDDLIRITALDTGRLELAQERVDVTYAVEEVIMNVANQYREKGLILRMTIDEHLPPLTADRDALLQVLGHLLTNAALASPVESEVQLLVTTRRDIVPAYGDDVMVPCLVVSVEDTGGGVAPADYDRVFMRKYRADNPLIEGLGDTGVSLSLAKALIDAHGGRVWLESQEGVGTTFHMLLPLEPPGEGGAG